MWREKNRSIHDFQDVIPLKVEELRNRRKIIESILCERGLCGVAGSWGYVRTSLWNCGRSTPLFAMEKRRKKGMTESQLNFWGEWDVCKSYSVECVPFLALFRSLTDDFQDIVWGVVGCSLFSRSRNLIEIAWNMLSMFICELYCISR